MPGSEDADFFVLWIPLLASPFILCPSDAFPWSFAPSLVWVSIPLFTLSLPIVRGGQDCSDLEPGEFPLLVLFLWSSSPWFNWHFSLDELPLPSSVVLIFSSSSSGGNLLLSSLSICDQHFPYFSSDLGSKIGLCLIVVPFTGSLRLPELSLLTRAESYGELLLALRTLSFPDICVSLSNTAPMLTGS